MRNLTSTFLLGMIFLFGIEACQKDDLSIQQDHEEVILRKIGHKILLLSNDSTSIVRPIVYENDKYRIQFESDFSFLPDELIKTIDTIVSVEFPDKSYLVQVENCNTKEIVYSYEIEIFPSNNDDIACSTREQPIACYEIIIQFISYPKQNNTWVYLFIFLVVLISLGGRYIYYKNKKDISVGKIKIGAFLYDPKRMTLTLVNDSIELTSKESDLLNLLYMSANETVDRETILNKVWGDEGDYVGRTLDVYVSKLRKKLEEDPTIEVRNIRGIGYKLIIEL